jgi:hypothetical protein
MNLNHPNHLEPNPLKREKFCPVKVQANQSIVSVHEVRREIIQSRTKTEALAALLRWASQYGINGDADRDWWEKRSKLGVD